MHIAEETSERHVLSITVTNEAGILAKIAGLFTARGYNIESLTVADISDDHQVSRITIVTNGPPRVIDQIIAQLDRLVPVHKVADLTEDGPFVERELALVKVAGKWAFRTAEDLSFLMHRETVEERKLSRAALETLSIIAYHQPVTRAEIEEVRGVTISKGTLDVLMEAGWVRMRGRRRTPGRPVTYGTTGEFLEHFGLDQISDLPGLDELKAAGLLSSRLPSGFSIPLPQMELELLDDEDPLEDSGSDDSLEPLDGGDEILPEDES